MYVWISVFNWEYNSKSLYGALPNLLTHQKVTMLQRVLYFFLDGQFLSLFFSLLIQSSPLRPDASWHSLLEHCKRTERKDWDSGIWMTCFFLQFLTSCCWDCTCCEYWFHVLHVWPLVSAFMSWQHPFFDVFRLKHPQSVARCHDGTKVLMKRKD